MNQLIGNELISPFNFNSIDFTMFFVILPFKYVPNPGGSCQLYCFYYFVMEHIINSQILTCAANVT